MLQPLPVLEMVQMNVHEAVEIARQWVRNIYSEEPIARLGLEEVEHDDHAGIWRITLGFSRNWESGVSGLASVIPAPRIYKTVIVDEATGTVTAMRNRETQS